MNRKLRGLPGLRKELFPAASWRSELESLHVEDRNRIEQLRTEEEARVALSLAGIRAEEVMRQARTQARRLVGTASAVARARQSHAERAAAAKMAKAEAAASATLTEAANRADAMVSDSGFDLKALYARLLQMQAALRDAETRLSAFAQATRADLVADDGIVDLDRLSGEPEGAVAVDQDAGDVYAVPVPRRRPKSRFEVPGLTPERIQALRDEFLTMP